MDKKHLKDVYIAIMSLWVYVNRYWELYIKCVEIQLYDVNVCKYLISCVCNTSLRHELLWLSFSSSQIFSIWFKCFPSDVNPFWMKREKSEISNERSDQAGKLFELRLSSRIIVLKHPEHILTLCFPYHCIEQHLLDKIYDCESVCSN